MAVVTLSGRQINIDASTLEALNTLDSCANGGFATVHRYVAGTSDPKCIRPRISTTNFISKFHYHRLVQKWLDKVTNVTIDDINTTHEKFKGMDTVELFNTAKAKVVESFKNTLNGDNNDGYRQGHERCYVHSSAGVKCHFVTEDGKVDGRKVKVPVLDSEGRPTVASIMVSVLEWKTTIHDVGEWKPTNSRPDTIMRDLIERKAKEGTLAYKMLSLKPDNFESIHIDNESIVPEDVKQEVYI